jgi:hypothetical protein
MRRVAETVVGLAEELGEFSAAELMGRLEDVESTNCATALQMAGQRKGNYAAAVEGAIARLRSEAEWGGLRAAPAALESRDLEPESTDRLQRQHEAARQRRHFLPTKLLRTRRPRTPAAP